MENEKLFRQLKAMGFDVGNAVIREDGTLLLRVNNVFMFRPDAVDLAMGHATVEQVLRRNKGKVFPNAPAPRSLSPV